MIYPALAEIGAKSSAATGYDEVLVAGEPEWRNEAARRETGIPLSDVEIVRSKRPDVEVFVYENAQHGFNCNERASYDKASSDIARGRSLDFLAKHLKA